MPSTKKICMSFVKIFGICSFLPVLTLYQAKLELEFFYKVPIDAKIKPVVIFPFLANGCKSI